MDKGKQKKGGREKERERERDIERESESKTLLSKNLLWTRANKKMTDANAMNRLMFTGTGTGGGL